MVKMTISNGNGKHSEICHWNYRVRKSTVLGEPSYTIIEAYYDDNYGVEGYVEDAAPFGNSKKELRKNLKRMLKALDVKTLEDKDLP